MKILVTAFDPFNGESINPAQEALALLPDAIGEAEIKKLTVPTVFFESVRVVIEAMALYQPDAVLMLGQAGGREGLTVERVALNFADADIRDNQGHQPQEEPIEKTGPAAYFATLPVKKMVSAIRENGLPAQISNTAGTFVCNHLFYSVLHHISARQLPCKAGFIHLPYLPEQAQKHSPVKPSMPLEKQVKGIIRAVSAIISEHYLL
ncbi:MAG: pyroglutamyl-peptidase I [Bacillota bacterium]|nr:pyroglutamyl-peptidase I [Bacillota bacterium]